MDSPQCKHEITEFLCAICHPVRREEARDLGPWVSAAYHGDCADCDERIEPGDEIRADGEGGWLCETCGG